MKPFQATASFVPLSCVALIALIGCAKHLPESPSEKPISVQIEKPQIVSAHDKIVASGSVASPDEPSTPSFLVSGRVLRVLYREGDAVRKGQLLATVDSRDYDLGVDASRAQTEVAKVALSHAGDEFRRMKALYDLKSLTPNDFEKYKAAFESAQRQLDQANASEDLARKRVSDAALSAPISGYISKRMIEPGSIVSPGMAAFQIVALDNVEIAVGIPETDIAHIRAGQRASVRLIAQPDTSFEGTVKRINVVADPETRTYAVRIAVSNPGHRLRIGMIAEVAIESDRQTEAITVPGSAIVHNAQGANTVYVYYAQQKRVFAKQVEIGGVYGQGIRIKSGISTTDPIVVGGQQFLRDGMLANPTEAFKTLPTQGDK